MDRWNEICFLIKEHSKQNSKEAFFQNEVVNIFEKLGWSRFKKEIETEKNIPIGATNRLRLDILISLEKEKLFVVELKKPTNQGSDRISQQLISYMLQLKMKFGLFIGENIQLFYDDPNDNKHPIKLIEIEFSYDNDEGYKLIEILKRDTFDEKKLIDYCNQKLKKIEENKTLNELIDFFTSTQGNEYVLQLFLNDLSEKHSSKIIEELKSKISINIKSNKYIEQNSDLIKNKISKPSRITSKNITKEGMKIGQFVQNNMRKVFEENLLTMEEIENLQNKDYSKKVFNIHYEVLRNKSREIRDENGNNRYYTKEIFGGNYYLTSQWIEDKHRERFTIWLNKRMKTKTFS
jgi:hypothetical protein